MAKANASNALVGARARITDLEHDLKLYKERLQNASDSNALYAKKADILTNGSNALKESIKELRFIVDEQRKQLHIRYACLSDMRKQMECWRLAALVAGVVVIAGMIGEFI